LSSHLSNFCCFSRDDSNGLGHPSSTFDTESPSASQPSLAESSPAESTRAESALGFPNQIAVALNKSPKSILANSEVPNDIVEALNETPEPIFTESTPEPILAESTPEILNNTVEALNKSPIFDVVDSASEIPDDIVEAVNQSPDSDPADRASEITSEITHDIAKALNKSPESNLAVPPHTSQTSIYGTLEPNCNKSEVSLLMRAAHKRSNPIAFRQVKALFKKAVRTKPKQRTPAQIYVLDNWDNHSARSRRSSTFSLHSTADPPSQAPESSSLSLPFPKIFVDASAYGIGFIFNDRWLAWTFTPNHPNIPLGRNKKIIISWGELIAVELGILTLLSCGYRDVKVLVKSDSTEAVDALMKRKPKPNHGLDDIRTRIFDLCNEARLELEMDLIPGKENPADGPSRGEYPPLDMMLDHSPRIPRQLQGVVIQVEAASEASLGRI